MLSESQKELFLNNVKELMKGKMECGLVATNNGIQIMGSSKEALGLFVSIVHGLVYEGGFSKEDLIRVINLADTKLFEKCVDVENVEIKDLEEKEKELKKEKESKDIDNEFSQMMKILREGKLIPEEVLKNAEKFFEELGKLGK